MAKNPSDRFATAGEMAAALSGGQYLNSITIQALGMRFNDQGDLFVAARTRVLKYGINLP